MSGRARRRPRAPGVCVGIDLAGVPHRETGVAVLRSGRLELLTSAGPDAVAISADSVGKTIAGATIKGQGNDLVLDTNSFYKPTQAGSYPIVLATYEIVCSKYSDAKVGAAVKAFLRSATGAGQTGLADNGYAPVPDEFRPRLAAAIDALS